MSVPAFELRSMTRNTIRVRFARRSGNKKTGPMLVTMVERATCPPTCPLMGEGGCYGSAGPMAIPWYQLDSGAPEQFSWAAMLKAIKRLDARESWRWASVGDLAHDHGQIDLDLLGDLVRANEGKGGFGYTHHQLTPHNVEALKWSNLMGFTLNISTESVDNAALIKRSTGLPVVAVVPSTETRKGWKAADGTPVLMCPHSYTKGRVQCFNCGGAGGPLCARPDRRFIVAFPAHASRFKKVDAFLNRKEVVG